jgi:hypothetical protein
VIQLKKKMNSLLKAASQVELDQIFLELEKSDEDGVKGILLNFKLLKFILNFNLFILYSLKLLNLMLLHH